LAEIVRCADRLNTVLEEHGLAATILPDISEQSIAGTISTSTHGFGLNFGTFSAYVLSLTIALADGTVVTCSRMERPKLFLASLCGLRLTGVVLRVKLQCERKFSVRAVTDVKYNLRDFLKGFQSELESAEHVAMMWWPEEDAVTLKKGDRTNEVCRA
jgi:FAD/FMN-containing dehydrogenase